MATNQTQNYEIPPEMRDFAEKSVEQARKAVDGFITQAQKAVTTAEAQANAAQSNAKDMGQKAMGFAEQNIANSFEFAQKLVRAKDIQEVMALQQEYLQTQMKAMSEQANDLGSAATKPSTALRACSTLCSANWRIWVGTSKFHFGSLAISCSDS